MAGEPFINSNNVSNCKDVKLKLLFISHLLLLLFQINFGHAYSGVPGGGQRGTCAPGVTLGGAEIDLVLKKSDQPIGASWPERS